MALSKLELLEKLKKDLEKQTSFQEKIYSILGENLPAPYKSETSLDSFFKKLEKKTSPLEPFFNSFELNKLLQLAPHNKWFDIIQSLEEPDLVRLLNCKDFNLEQLNSEEKVPIQDFLMTKNQLIPLNRITILFNNYNPQSFLTLLKDFKDEKFNYFSLIKEFIKLINCFSQENKIKVYHIFKTGIDHNLKSTGNLIALLKAFDSQDDRKELINTYWHKIETISNKEFEEILNLVDEKEYIVNKIIESNYGKINGLKGSLFFNRLNDEQKINYIDKVNHLKFCSTAADFINCIELIGPLCSPERLNEIIGNSSPELRDLYDTPEKLCVILKALEPVLREKLVKNENINWWFHVFQGSSKNFNSFESLFNLLSDSVDACSILINKSGGLMNPRHGYYSPDFYQTILDNVNPEAAVNFMSDVLNDNKSNFRPNTSKDRPFIRLYSMLGDLKKQIAAHDKTNYKIESLARIIEVLEKNALTYDQDPALQNKVLRLVKELCEKKRGLFGISRPYAATAFDNLLAKYQLNLDCNQDKNIDPQFTSTIIRLEEEIHRVKTTSYENKDYDYAKERSLAVLVTSLLEDSGKNMSSVITNWKEKRYDLREYHFGLNNYQTVAKPRSNHCTSFFRPKSQVCIDTLIENLEVSPQR